jgi:hypothetical protein
MQQKTIRPNLLDEAVLLGKLIAATRTGQVAQPFKHLDAGEILIAHFFTARFFAVRAVTAFAFAFGCFSRKFARFAIAAICSLSVVAICDRNLPKSTL